MAEPMARRVRGAGLPTHAKEERQADGRGFSGHGGIADDPTGVSRNENLAKLTAA